MASFIRAAARPAARCATRPTARIPSLTLQRQYASAAASVASTDNAAPSLFPDEPTGAIVRTEIPGPKSKAAIERLGKVFDTRSLNMMANYNQSYGN